MKPFQSWKLPVERSSGVGGLVGIWEGWVSVWDGRSVFGWVGSAIERVGQRSGEVGRCLGWSVSIGDGRVSIGEGRSVRDGLVSERGSGR